MLEYAIHLSSIVENLPKIPVGDDGKPFVEKDEVLYRIQDGDYLLIVAGDKLDSRAVKLSEALLGKHLLRPWHLALVEVAVFEHQIDSGLKSHLLVPHLQGAIVPVRRQVVTIDIHGDRTRIDVSPATPAAVGEGWDEEKFFREVETSKVSDPVRQFARGLRDLPNEHAHLALAFGRGATPSLTLRNDGHGIVTLYIWNFGNLSFNKPAFSRALGSNWGEFYRNKLEVLFPEEMKKNDWVSVRLQPKTAAKLLGELSTLIKDVLMKSTEDEKLLDHATIVQ